jgi:uncharacterized protein YxeA
MKKIAIGIVSILILVVLASGCTSYNNNTTSNQSSSNVTVQVSSNSSWNGTLAYNNGTHIINGNDSATYNLGPKPGAVTVSLEKTGSSGTLTLQLLKGGNILQTQSTSATHGIVTISNTF